MVEFSIIVPIYNVEKFLNACIDSILAQTYRDFELILVDDGSPDGCGAICDCYAKNDARIKVIHQKNGGLVRARKTGIQAAQGDYICWVDGDDFVDSTMLETLHQIIQEQKPDMIAFGYKTVSQDGQTIFHEITNALPDGKYILPGDGHFYDALIYDRKGIYGRDTIRFSLCMKAIRREKLMPCEMAVPDAITIGEDMSAVFPCICQCDSVVVHNFTPYSYRQNEESMTQTFHFDQLERQEALLRYLYTATPRIDNKNIDTYAFKKIYQHAADAAKQFKTRVEFVQYMRSEITPYLQEILDRAEYPNAPKKIKIKYLLLKRGCYGIFWKIQTRKIFIKR